MKEKLADKLILGAHNIDRMRKEIQEVVSIIIGYIKKYHYLDKREYSSRTPCFHYRSDNSNWQVTIKLAKNSIRSANDEIIVECWSAETFTSHWAYRSVEGFNLKTEDVRFVHEDLETFVSGVNRSFLFLKEVWGPLIKASELKF